MKKSFIIGLLVSLALALASCGGPGTANVSVSEAPKTIVAGGDFCLTVQNELEKEVSPKIELKVGGEVQASERVELGPRESQSLCFAGQFKEPGEYDVEIADLKTTVKVIAHPGELPPNPKVIGPGQGLVELGMPGGKLVISTMTGPKTLNHHIGQETSTTYFTYQMHAGLVETNLVTAEIEPALATHWDISPDKKEIIFHLREGVKFSDGHPFTADDVVFTFNDIIFNEDVNTDARDVMQVRGEPIKVEKVDDYTVKVITPEPFRPIFRIIGTAIMPKHKLAKYIAKLNPGAAGSLRGVKNKLDEQREVLQGLAPEKIAAIDERLEDLSKAIDAKDSARMEGGIPTIKEKLEELEGFLAEEQEDLKEVLSSIAKLLDESLAFAQEGKFAGVPPGNFNDTWALGTPPEEIVGLGPFVFKEYITDQQAVLERNPYYWKVDQNGVQLPYVNEFIFLVVGTLDVAFLKFQTGEIDTYGPRPEDWPLLVESAEEKGWELLRAGPTFGTAFVCFNQDVEDDALRAVFRSRDFRRAIAHAVDKGTIIDNIYNGLAIPQWSPVSVPSPYYDRDETFAKYEFDLEESGELLDGLSLVDTDGDGIRNITDQFLISAGLSLEGRSPPQDERELEFVLITNRGNTIREDLGNLFTNDWLKLGIKVNFKPIDFNSLVTDLLGAKYEAVIIGFTGGVEPNNGGNVWRSDGGLHFWHYSGKEEPYEWEKRVDELFDLGATTFDEDKVKEIYAEYQRLVSEHLSVIYTVNQQYIYASKEKLGNNESFNPIGSIVYFAEYVWWKD